jgi:iron complex transport system ATP-binding protein
VFDVAGAAPDGAGADELHVRVQRATLGRRVVLNDVAFQCSAGTHLGVLGTNGAGKTTLLRCIAGLLPFDGEIQLGASALSELSPLERARKIAYVPQRSLLDAPLSVREVVMQGRFCHQDAFGTERPSDQRAVERSLLEMDLVGLAGRSFIRLSGGEQRRVLLARALATEANVIVLDEPSAALDIAHALALFAHLKRLAAQGKIVITVLHHLPDAERWCDQLCLLHEERLHYFGSAPLSAALVREVYGVEVDLGAANSYSLPVHEGALP